MKNVNLVDQSTAEEKRTVVRFVDETGNYDHEEAEILLALTDEQIALLELLDDTLPTFSDNFAIIKCPTIVAP